MPGATFKLTNAFAEGTPDVGRYFLRTLLAGGDIDSNQYQLLYASQLILSSQDNNVGSIFIGGVNVTPTNYGAKLPAGSSLNESLPVSLDDYVCTDTVQAAPSAPTVANGAAGTNLLTAGVYRWKITFVTADGETTAGTASSPLTVNPAAELPPALSGIPLGGTGVTARKVYRTAAGGSIYKLEATISDNTTTTSAANVADASLGAVPPTANSAFPAYINVFWRVGLGSPLGF